MYILVIVNVNRQKLSKTKCNVNMTPNCLTPNCESLSQSTHHTHMLGCIYKAMSFVIWTVRK